MSYIHVLLNHVAQDFVYETTLGCPTGGLGVQELKRNRTAVPVFSRFCFEEPRQFRKQAKGCKRPTELCRPIQIPKGQSELLLDLGPQTQNILYPGVSHLC